VKNWHVLVLFLVFSVLALKGWQDLRVQAEPAFKGSCADYGRAGQRAIWVELHDCVIAVADIASYTPYPDNELWGRDLFVPLMIPGSTARSPLVMKLNDTESAGVAHFEAIAEDLNRRGKANDPSSLRALLPAIEHLQAPRTVTGYIDPDYSGAGAEDFRNAVGNTIDGTPGSGVHLAEGWRVVNTTRTRTFLRYAGIAELAPIVILVLFLAGRLGLFLRSGRAGSDPPACPPGFTRMDIRAAARAARHLYLWSAFAVLIGSLLGIVALIAAGIVLSTTRATVSEQLCYGVLPLALAIAFLVVLVRARLRFNWLGYLLTGLTLVAMLAGGVLALVYASGFTLKAPLPVLPVADFLNAAVLALIVAAMLFALFAWIAVVFTRYPDFGRSPLGVAASVSGLISRTRRLRPSPIHPPRNPVRTLLACGLFVLSIPGAVAIAAVVPVVGLFLPIFAAALVRRHYTHDAKTLLALDRRPPVLYLRSFGDDRARTWGKGFYGKFRGRTLDEAVAPFARLIGPYIAIANPNEKLPHIGAAQSHFTDETWQDAIAQWVGMSQLIVMQAGRTEGIAWELSHIFGAQRHSRLVVLIPPAMRKNPAVLAQWLEEHFVDTPFAGLVGSVDPPRTIALVFHESGLVAIESGEIRNAEIDYLVAFQHAVFIEFCWQQAPEPAAVPESAVALAE